jgi:hypothetical protein
MLALHVQKVRNLTRYALIETGNSYELHIYQTDQEGELPAGSVLARGKIYWTSKPFGMYACSGPMFMCFHEDYVLQERLQDGRRPMDIAEKIMPGICGHTLEDERKAKEAEARAEEGLRRKEAAFDKKMQKRKKGILLRIGGGALCLAAGVAHGYAGEYGLAEGATEGLAAICAVASQKMLRDTDVYFSRNYGGGELEDDPTPFTPIVTYPLMHGIGYLIGKLVSRLS